MSPKIFINYRKEDSPWNSVALYSELMKHFPKENIFKDFNNIKPGYDFVESIEEELEKCDILLVLIGSKWLKLKGKTGKRRIDDPDDFVRLEIATALKRKIPVIPIIFDDAKHPGADELPDDIKGLSRRQFIKMDKMRFEGDTFSLIKAINDIIEKKAALPETEQPVKEPIPKPEKIKEPEVTPVVNAANPVAENQSTRLPESSNRDKGFNKNILWGIAGVAFVVLMIIIYKQFNNVDAIYDLKIHSVDTNPTYTRDTSLSNKVAAYMDTIASIVSKPETGPSKISLLTLPDNFSISDKKLKDYKDYGKLPKATSSDGIEFNYEGGVLNGKPNGYGVAKYEDGAIFRGKLINGDRNGKGKLLYKNGDKYEGDWKDDKRDGKGTIIFNNGEKYEGDWKNDKKNGKGTSIWKGGDKYMGEWKDGKMDGYGEYYVGSGNEFTYCPGCVLHKGNRKNDVKSGDGKCYDMDGKLLYDGPFADDKPVNKYPQK